MRPRGKPRPYQKVSKPAAAMERRRLGREARLGTPQAGVVPNLGFRIRMTVHEGRSRYSTSRVIDFVSLRFSVTVTIPHNARNPNSANPTRFVQLVAFSFDAWNWIVIGLCTSVCRT